MLRRIKSHSHKLMMSLSPSSAESDAGMNELNANGSPGPDSVSVALLKLIHSLFPRFINAIHCEMFLNGPSETLNQRFIKVLRKPNKPNSHTHISSQYHCQELPGSPIWQTQTYTQNNPQSSGWQLSLSIGVFLSGCH